jgi:metallo-beta-lactamase family protein
MQLTFLGATQTVTGSKYLLEHEHKKILVDCGLFQGYKPLRLRNWEDLPVHPSTIDAVLLTHAHLDHSGYIPRLVRAGFTGTIYCSAATLALCKILLLDAGHLQEEDAARANRYGYTKHQPALPLYTKEEAAASLQYFQPVDFGKAHSLGGGLSFTLSRSGHILGSAFIEVNDGRTSVLFSGDLGRPHDPVMKPPATLQHSDYLILESTYGNRLHDRTDPAETIGAIINSTAAKGGKVIIPAFAVGRAQSVLYYVQQLQQAGAIPQLPVFLDSPMAINATELFCEFKHEHKLPEYVCAAMCGLATYTRTVEASKRIDQSPLPSVIISASGMATGGRVLHHFKALISDPRHTILLTGFQAGGTRGDRMLKGEKHIKIHGAMYPVRARVEAVSNTSAHADYEEILAWLGNFRQAPRKVFITHGEAAAAAALQEKIHAQFGWHVVIPDYLQAERL